MELKNDQQFQNQIPALTDEEFEQLRENILNDGEVYEPIVTWNGTILDGHNRWRIIRENWDKLKDKFHVKEVEFPDRCAASEWIYKKQLGRRNLTEEQRARVIGMMYQAQKQTRGGDHGNQYTEMANRQNVSLPNKNAPSDSTAEEIGKLYGMSGRSVLRAAKFANGVDALKAVSAEAADKVLKGQAKVTKEMIYEFPKLPFEMMAEIADQIIRGEPVRRLPVEKTPVPAATTSPGEYQLIPISEIDDFPDFPFQVCDDEEMDALEESIEKYGLLVPVFVRKKENGRYEMISGHRRKRACELAGMESILALVREMTDDEAIIFMVDSNLQQPSWFGSGIGCGQ